MPKIEFLPANGSLLNIAPNPEPAIMAMPEWWRKQQSFLNGNNIVLNGSYQSTVKKCQAIFDGITTGYILRCPIDILVKKNGDSFSIEVPNSFEKDAPWIISGHARDQVSDMPINKDIYYADILRIHPLWVAQTPKGYSTLFMQPILREYTPIMAIPAVIDTDKFPSDGHLSFFLDKNFEGIIKQGTPIAQIFPFKREEWTHSIEEYKPGYIENKRQIVRSTFTNGYRLKFWTKKEYK